MARKTDKTKKNIESYAHTDKERVNNPPVGLVTPETDKDVGKKTYAHDPYIDPQLGWAKLAKNLKAEIDQERIEAYRGAVSLPFEAGDYKRVAVKIVDDRGIESLKVILLD